MAIFIATIHTHLPIDEAQVRIKALIEAPARRWSSWFAWPPPVGSRPFAGSFGAMSFKIMRIIAYRNSFLPVIRGTLSQGDVGTDVRLVMTLHPLVALFMLVWCGGLARVAMSVIETSHAVAAVPPLLLCLFGIGLTIGGFIPEAFKATRLIRESLEAA